ncbi:MAG: VOC family protein [Gammaproteobacteria bacterium]|jgi:catechol 2,3-dioxygenase-like lactoylglutathione lyase family enzyme|nr:VOC family protein [Gammaproteobacteria bacterium]
MSTDNPHQSSLPVSTAGIAYVTISVADMDAALAFWVGHLGLEVSARHLGADKCAGTLWGIAADEVVDQVLLTTPGSTAGRIHLLQFKHTGAAVRQNAAATDLGPKNLDITCADIHRHVAELKDAGFVFRSEIGEYILDELPVREVQMHSHDETNIVFIEVRSSVGEFEENFSAAGFAAITSFVVIVPDTVPEGNFYRDVFGWDEVLHHRVSGPEIEALIGLPKGAALELRMLGKASEPFGRMELVSYEGIEGMNRFERTVAGATGVITCSIVVEDIDSVAAKLETSDFGEQQTMLGAARVMRSESPAGMKLDLLQLKSIS